MDLGLAGRVALVCGSTKGLGRAVAKALAHEGARVAINGRHEDSVEHAAQQLSSESAQAVMPFVADVGDPSQAEGLVERVHHQMGRLDVLFCNASGPPAAPFTHQPAEAFHRAVELNLLSTVHLARAAVPIMRKLEWGRIICLASVAAKQPLPGLILSTTAGAGVLGFAKALADEVAAEGITVNVVIPSAATSSARAFANPRTPARAVVERMSPGRGCLAATDARQIMRPHSSFRMMGTAARAR